MNDTNSDTVAEAPLEPLHERLAKNPDGIVERIAREYGVSTLAVVEALPAAHRTLIKGELFAEVMKELESWGEILFIVHTPDIVLECAGTIPPGSFGRGYYNIHGDSPIGGHIRAEACARIVFLARPFMGRHSCSIQFFNGDGEAMFKVFVRRDEKRELLADQVAKFEAMRAKHANGPNA
jgi:putative heme utilization carrier protein HutX